MINNEALSQPVAYDYQIAGACIADGHNENGKWVHWRNELDRERPPVWMLEEGKVKDLKPRYSQEYVTALLAALEEANSKNFQTQMFEWIGRYEAERKRVDAAEQQITSLFERVSGEQVSNYPAGCIDWLADMIEGELCASEGALSAMRTRAKAAEQRLQQPIKLPRTYEITGEFSAVVMKAEKVRQAIRNAGFKVKGE